MSEKEVKEAEVVEKKSGEAVEEAETREIDEVVTVAEETKEIEEPGLDEKKDEKKESKEAERKSDVADEEPKDTAEPDEAEAKVKETSADTKNKAPEKAKPSGLAVSAFIMSVVALAGMAGCAGYCIYDFLQNDESVVINYNTGVDGNSASFTEGSMADVVSQVSPAVVSIVLKVNSTNFFGQNVSSSAAGTGMIVTSDGYVLTNKHVVEDGTSFSIVLDDGTTYNDVSVVGTDPSNDLAFLKINGASDLPTVTLGDSKTLTAGQQVLAIGNALGEFQNTVSSGIISGLGRSIVASSSDYSNSEQLSDLIQTDAAINSGNSGGPLVNAAGQVIGVNVATSTSADGIGFSIPIASAKGMLKSLISTGRLERSFLGVRYTNIDSTVASNYSLPVTAGAYINTDSGSGVPAVVAGSPAATAGLQAGDIITAVNGYAIKAGCSLSTLLGEYAPGDTVQLTVLRDGEEATVRVTLAVYEN